MAIQDIAVASVPVSDPERAKTFYVDTLGFELLRDDKDDESVPGIRWVQVAPKGSPASLALVTWFDSMPPGSLRGLVIRSDDIEADYKRLAASGVQFEGPHNSSPGRPKPCSAIQTATASCSNRRNRAGPCHPAPSSRDRRRSLVSGRRVKVGECRSHATARSGRP
jgi:catechol 2,3-dioxygenase-like lactoylglutathione lyase family enzyme